VESKGNLQNEFLGVIKLRNKMGNKSSRKEVFTTAIKGDFESVKESITEGVPIHPAISTLAIRENRDDITNLMIEYGIPTYATDLDLACLKGNLKIVKILTENRSTIHDINRVLPISCRYDKVDIARYLVSKGAIWEDSETLKCLLKHKIYVNLDEASERLEKQGKLEMLQFLDANRGQTGKTIQETRVPVFPARSAE
jgi:hypothetical protein